MTIKMTPKMHEELMKKWKIGLCISVITLSTAVNAKPYELVSEHSKIGFDVDYMSMTKVEGRFKKYRGFFNLSEDGSELSNVKVIVEGSSVDTNDDKRDFHLKGHEFFFVASYPEMIFTSNHSVKISEGKSFTLPGELTIRGITKPMTLKGTYVGVKKDPWGKDNNFFTLTGELNRKDFGIVWNKDMDTGGYLVGEQVRLTLSVQAQGQGEKTSFSTHMVPHTKAIQERSDLKKGKIKKLSTATDENDHKAPK